MAQSYARSILFQAILLTVARAQDIGTITQNIASQPAFSQQKECARNCFQSGGPNCNDDILGHQIGCAVTFKCETSWQARNDCYCSANLQIPAQEFLSRCITKACSVADVSVDVSSAVSIYSRYCGEKGYVAGSPASVLATRTGSAAPSRATSSSHSEPTGTTSDSTGSSTSDPPSSSKLSVGTIIGIVVGGCGGLLLIAAAAYIFYRLYLLCTQRRPSNFASRPEVDHRPIFPPQQPNQHPYFPSPGPTSEVGPSDSVSMAGGLAQQNPTLVSDNRYPRWA